MYNIVHMTQVNVSQFRQNLPSLLDRVFAGEELLILRNRIPMVTISRVKRDKVFKKRILPGATKLMIHLKGKSVDIVNGWRKREEMRSYGN